MLTFSSFGKGAARSVGSISGTSVRTFKFSVCDTNPMVSDTQVDKQSAEIIFSGAEYCVEYSILTACPPHLIQSAFKQL